MSNVSKIIQTFSWHNPFLTILSGHSPFKEAFSANSSVYSALKPVRCTFLHMQFRLSVTCGWVGWGGGGGGFRKTGIMLKLSEKNCTSALTKLRKAFSKAFSRRWCVKISGLVKLLFFSFLFLGTQTVSFSIVRIDDCFSFISSS